MQAEMPVHHQTLKVVNGCHYLMGRFYRIGDNKMKNAKVFKYQFSGCLFLITGIILRYYLSCSTTKTGEKIALMKVEAPLPVK
jgi:hypothetical protein